jgi:hypothetical protein
MIAYLFWIGQFFAGVMVLALPIWLFEKWVKGRREHGEKAEGFNG